MAEPITFPRLRLPVHSEPETPEARVDFDHADLQFHDVDHSGHSYEVRIYFDNTQATEETGLDEAAGYVDSFYIFGHGGCYGEEGHCDPHRRGKHPYDRRLPHPLLPMLKNVEVTRTLTRLRDEGVEEVDVTLVPIRSAASAELAPDDVADELRLESVSLVTYETFLAKGPGAAPGATAPAPASL